MKKSFTIIAVLILLVSLSSGIQSDKFDKLLQLRGTWAMQTRKGLLYEEWKKTKDNEISGRSYKLNASDTVMLEKVTLKEEGTDIFYIPTVQNQNNQQPVTFRLISVDGNKFTFENKLHDFPQRIIYNLVSNDSLVARIEGTKNGNTAGSDYYFKRVK